jgi:diguanylate cyclase (GGDEF)-like protein
MPDFATIDATLDRIPSLPHGLYRPNVGPRADLARAIEQRDAIRDEAFLIAFLPYAVAQAKRHAESVSLLCIGTDRLAAIRDLLGEELGAAAVRRVAETVARTLRSSDVVALLDDGRIVAVLPFAAASDLPMIAEAVREAVARAGVPTRSMPRLTASVGLAAYPEHALDAGALLNSALNALDRTRSRGPNQTAEAEPEPAAVVSRGI